MTLLQTLFLSYNTWPLDQLTLSINAEVATFFLKQLDMLMYTTVLLAGPMIGIMFLTDFGAGLVGRYLPQLNIFLIAMPIKSGVAFFILIFYIAFIADYMKDSFVKVSLVLPQLENLLR